VNSKKFNDNSGRAIGNLSKPNARAEGKVKAGDNSPSLFFCPPSEPAQRQKSVSPTALAVGIPQENRGGLDTLAQLRKIDYGTGMETLRKRARSKFITSALTLRLCDVKGSKLNKSYWNTFYCSSALEQEGTKIKGKYCGNRWCLTCNRIRTAKLIKGYSKPLSVMVDKYFLTLTIPNVKAAKLNSAMKGMIAEIKKISDTLRKRKTKLIGLRKLECTYNNKTDTFHPHFHFIIENKTICEEIQKMWLDRFPDANIKGQNLKPCTANYEKELFKYFTKILVSKETTDENGKYNRTIFVEALDTIFNSLKGIRIFQPMGIKMEKEISEDIDEIIVQEVHEKFTREGKTNWTWYNDEGKCDWIDISTGECLTNYEKSKAIIEMEKNILHKFGNNPDQHFTPQNEKIITSLSPNYAFFEK